ncbi:MAG: DUF721 domain-containing protein [Flavobacteriales bacterium]|nr:DUF721 domain-containing protein [Flavobacteriales bacterium]
MRSQEKSIGEILKLMTREYGMELKLLQAQAIDAWYQEVPPIFKEHISEVFMMERKMIVRLDDDVMRHELLYHRTTLIDRINQKLEKPLVNEIVFK